jgi:hypothetical protein
VSAVPWHNQSVTALVQYLETDMDRGLLEMEADACMTQNIWEESICSASQGCVLEDIG